MASTTGQQFLDIEIKDDMKYDIRIENAHIERYLLLSLPASSVTCSVV